MTTAEIKIFYYEDFPDKIIDEFVDTTKGDGYEIVVKKGERRYLNFIEDFLPTVIISLTTYFVAGFLGKVGSDAYDKLASSIPKLKKSLSEFLVKIKDIKAYILRSGQEPEPTNCNLSLILEIHEKLNIDFFFSGKTDLKTLRNSSDLLFQMLTDKKYKVMIKKLINDIEPDEKRQTVKIQFDETKGKWTIFDPVEEKFKQLSKMMKELDD
ncbi:hypothetical protein ES705_32253 [subsurface metagenome]